MDVAYITALSALAGSVVGGLTLRIKPIDIRIKPEEEVSTNGCPIHLAT
jgi:hypothetical protein